MTTRPISSNIVVKYDGDGDDTVSIVACMAAAVIITMILVAEHRKK